MRLFPKKRGGHVFTAPPRKPYEPDPTDDLYKFRKNIQLRKELIAETRKNHNWD